MPESIIGWIMFAFFVGGSLGGWVLLFLWLQDKLGGAE